MSGSRLIFLRYILIAGILGLVIGGFLALGPPRLLAKSAMPDFCSSCHVMEAEYEAWFHEGHRTINCVDCHLPHENIATHYIWKSIDGMKDVVVFYSGKVPEIIRISEHGQNVVRTNCVRCHESMVELIDNGRLCWDCHRRMAHIRSGALETR
jgi:cytochrome c nitrite reductase small subunit